MQQRVLYSPGEALPGLDIVDYQSPAYNESSGICWHNIWDAREARFEPCFLPVIGALPAVLAAIVLFCHIVSALIRWRPSWTKRFVEEYADDKAEDACVGSRQWTRASATVTGVSSIALVLQTTLVITTWPQKGAILQPLPWLITVSLLAVRRPRTVPLSLLGINVVLAICQSVILTGKIGLASTTDNALQICTLTLSAFAILIMTFMPFRDPRLPAKDISQPRSEPTSVLRSPEDNLSLWQFMTVSWMTPLISVGCKRQLDDEDVWQLSYEFQHRRLHDNFRVLKGTVVRRLLKANGIDLVILTTLGLVELVTRYSVPVLLQKLLASMQDVSAPRKAAITYAALSLAVRLITAQSGVFSLWYGRRCYERARGEMITMLYEKTLGRKVSFQQPQQKQEPDGATSNGISANGSHHAKEQRPLLKRVAGTLREWFGKKPKNQEVKEPASMGKILNLMRNDVYEVAQRFWEFQSLITKPLNVVFSATLVVNFLGWPSMVAVGAMILAQAINAVLVRILIHYEKKRRAATDSKLQIITQFVEAIRHLRWYGWQDAWLDRVFTQRQKELNLRIVTGVWNVAIITVNALALDLTPVIAFAAYTIIAKKNLTIDIAFPALTLFDLLTSSLRDLPGLITVVFNAFVAVGRIEDFMAEPDKDDVSTAALIGDSLALDHASFSWPGTSMPVLMDISLSFPPGLSVICGEVAAGKSALLQALLGELDMLDGQLIKPSEAVGYCTQSPWLQSMSIRENILFSSPYEDKRYREVIDACALTPDLAELKAGDLSFIGENGIGLSGGQRARVALARAVYSSTNILLLDDPLSALDQQTAEAIVQKLFTGPLLKGRIVVLVTHRTDLVLGVAEQVIEIDQGRASVVDHDAAAGTNLKRMASVQSQDEGERQALEKRNAAAVPDKFIEDEHRAHGGVQASVYWEYVKAGDLRWWFLLVLVLTAYRLFAVGGAWFLKAWGEAYSTQSSMPYSAHAQPGLSPLPGLFDGLPRPDVNIIPWLIGFAIFGLGRSLTYDVSQGIILVIIYTAGKRMFIDIMDKVSHATFRFYDVTPVGRLMNRMTGDISVIDGGVSQQFQSIAWLLLSWGSSIIVIASVTPTFLIFSIILSAAFVLIFRRFLPTSQSLRRLEMVSLTPLMSNFGALLNGLTTVRAFHAQSRFQDRVVKVVDTFQKMDHFYWSLQAWLMYRFDSLSALSTFLLTMLALITNTSPGLTAFVLVAAQKYVGATHALCKQYGQLQMEFVSVERIVELLHLDQEPRGNIRPPAWWPSFSGDLVFDNVTIKYAPHLDPALSKVSFTVKGGSKTAVIGRTGSGKSTLALAMLATIVPDVGQVLIDNVDLAAVDKQTLRTRVTFLAQDPVLFPGSLRQNLDPLVEHTDAACEAVLVRVCERQGFALDTHVETGGQNLSQGQRQLIGLARAVLRRSAIIILDEATASIDTETAIQIQQVLHEEMKQSTVITIAHRLEAVRNADYCIVLGKGKIIEEGPAEDMLRDHRDNVLDNTDE